MSSTPAQAFRKLVTSPTKMRLFMLQKLPMALVAGLRVVSISDEQAAVTIPYKYVNKNPFRSIYFASLSMAAELSTGLLAMMHSYQSEPGISMLLVHLEGGFTKKATGKIIFTCTNGEEIKATIERAKATAEGHTVTATSTGVDMQGD